MGSSWERAKIKVVVNVKEFFVDKFRTFFKL